MSDFKKTVIKGFTRTGDKQSKDSSYWENLEFPVTRKGHGAVTHIDFSPVDPYHYAVTSSVKVEIFSSSTGQLVKTLTKFKEQAFSGCFRKDGNLLVAGSAEGRVKLFDVSGKGLLRQFTGHDSPIHVAQFMCDNLHVVSGGDDNVVRMYDIASEKELVSFREHEDYIRGGSVSTTSKDIFITGSYDHKVKLYDARTEKSVLNVDHGCPVECVLMHPGGNIFYSAGGETIKVWDALTGGKLITSFSNHHKTVTCLCFCRNNKRLVSGSLDRHVKIYDMATYDVVHTLDYVSAVLSVGVAKDDSLVAVGTSDGYLITQRLGEGEIQDQQKDKKKKSSYKYAIKTHVARKDDHVILREKQERLAMYDKYFKNFQYSRAFDSAMGMGTQNPERSISILQELIRRGGMRRALAGRDEKSLAHVMKFLFRNVTDSKYTNTVLDVTEMVLDVHRDKFNGQSRLLTSRMKTLKSTIDKELSYLKQTNDVMGMLDTILTASQNIDGDKSVIYSDDLKDISKSVLSSDLHKLVNSDNKSSRMDTLEERKSSSSNDENMLSDSDSSSD